MKAALLSLTLAATTSASMPSRAEPPLLTPPPPPSDQPLPDLQQRGRSCAASAASSESLDGSRCQGLERVCGQQQW